MGIERINRKPLDYIEDESGERRNFDHSFPNPDQDVDKSELIWAENFRGCLDYEEPEDREYSAEEFEELANKAMLADSMQESLERLEKLKEVAEKQRERDQERIKFVSAFGEPFKNNNMNR